MLNSYYYSPYSFEGRTRCAWYWLPVLVMVALALPVNILLNIPATLAQLHQQSISWLNCANMVFSTVLDLALLPATLAFSARRLHDVGWSGWWQLLWLVPVFGWVACLVLLFWPSMAGPNRFGPQPTMECGTVVPPGESGLPWSCTAWPQPEKAWFTGWELVGLIVLPVIFGWNAFIKPANHAGAMRLYVFSLILSNLSTIMTALIYLGRLSS
ncbi:DUF805 domain-containing protein [Formicincola oecophyllae]|uniref:DUF805 domain-containing protein n=2 Tax=Formicincola oecophyllae TaxID=2558361 RepID=A0A4Y6UA81_9PROT|nr:DUF805 domain-containing protein [Formicincola oecophyllae]